MKINAMVMLIVSSALFMSTAYATIPNTDDPTTFLGPTLRLGFTNNMTDTSAYSIAGEAGRRNYRLAAALGWQISGSQRFKISAEYLRQNIAYAFFDGNTDQWVEQGAISADFESDILDTTLCSQFTLNANLSRAPSKTLRTDAGDYTNSSGIIQPFTEAKRLAGSTGGGFSPGIAIVPWRGGKVAAEVNFDSTRYDTVYFESEHASGVGGTVRVNQLIAEDVAVNLVGAFRQPYINYHGSIAWSNIPCYGKWTVGLMGEYTKGKNTLPDTYNVGISADYFIDQLFESPLARSDGIDRFMHARERVDFNGEPSVTQRMERQEFLSWTSRPSVYMPQVLAITDSQVN